jgi:hypothetical protein
MTTEQKLNNVPSVTRLAQWDWEGKPVSNPQICEAAVITPGAKPCTSLARYLIDGEPMCKRHASLAVLRRLDPESKDEA